MQNQEKILPVFAEAGMRPALRDRPLMTARLLLSACPSVQQQASLLWHLFVTCACWCGFIVALVVVLFFLFFFHAEQMAGETKSQTCCSCWKVKLRCKQPTHAHIGFGDAAKSSNCDKLWSASLKKKKPLAWSFCCSCLTCWIVVLPFSVLPSVMLESSRKLTNCLGYGPKNRKTAVSNRNGRLPVSFRHWGSCNFFVGLLMIDKVGCQDMTVSSWTIITVFWQVVKCHPHANKLFFFTLNANLIQIWQNLFWSWRGMAESARG